MLGTLGILIITYVVLPCGFLIWLWQGKEHSKLNWFAKLLVVTFYGNHILLSGRWDWVSYYLRIVWLIWFMAAAYQSWLKARSLPLYPPRRVSDYSALGMNSLLVLLFLATLSRYVPHGYTFQGDPVQLTFPLQNGTYYVGQGGNSSMLNYHHDYPAQRYALDIVQLNGLGARAMGLYPRSLTQYVIFEQQLYSPCEGIVRNTVNDLPDGIPPESDRQNPAGNHILLECAQADILMAHLQRGSIRVQEGEAVQVRQAIAKVGNSGNTSEPHLHIHAHRANTGSSILDGEGVPITFADRFLVRNSLVVQNPS